jgi:hypothetical protein
MKIETATVIFKNDDEKKSLIVKIRYDEFSDNYNVSIEADPKEPIQKVFESNKLYTHLAGALLDAIGDIETVE